MGLLLPIPSFYSFTKFIKEGHMNEFMRKKNEETINKFIAEQTGPNKQARRQTLSEYEISWSLKS